jgi:pyruvate formate lyase activating enzyme
MLSLHQTEGEILKCLLCPHYCKLKAGRTGICGVRKNTGEKIELLTYGVISGISSDPIEKKPLYHYFPGQNILSIGSYGCNMKCDFCHNFSISQNIPAIILNDTSPDQIVKTALSTTDNIGIAFTYNEPVIWFEYMKDVAIAVKNSNLSTVMVSNGFVNIEPLDEIIQFIDAFNIDLKAFNNEFYRKLTGSDLNPVKNSLKQIIKGEKHLEITTLIIPGQNDSVTEMEQQTKWIAGELGKNVPLHLSKYFPMHKRNDPATSQESIERLYEIASKNLDYVYMGNTRSDSGKNTNCPNCRTTVTIRTGYKTRILNLDKEGKCTGCGNLIYRNFTISSLKDH